MIFIDSSNVEQIGFDDQAGEIHVIFKNGRHYIYSPASQEVFDEFRNAPSKGTYLNQVIKPRYSCREV
ncbi:MAG TPA: KTSC domain-containing protein [Rhizomicrobium sp.]